MFQQKRACERAGSSRQSTRSMWLIGAGASEPRCGAGEVVLVDPARLGAVQVEEARARLAEVAGHGRQERAGADDVAARPLALEALPEPEQRRARGRRARPPPRSGRPGRPSPPRPTPACSPRAAARARPSRPCARRGSPRRRAPRGRATCRSANARAASLPGNGCRWRSAASAVGVRTGSTTTTRAGDSGSQCSWACGAEAEGFAPQTRMQAESRAVSGSKPTSRGAVDVLERDVPGLVADRVRVDLGRAEPVEEPQREEVGEEREGARVVGVQDGVRRPRPPRCAGGARRSHRAPRPRRRARTGPRPSAPTRRSGRVSRASGSRKAPL